MQTGSCECGAVKFRLTGPMRAKHIFVADKGDTYDIPDDVQQLEDYG